jgi:predicted Zn-dependent protease
MRMTLTMAALAFLASVPVATAEVVNHPTAGLQLDLPAGWKTRTNAGQLVAEPPNGKAYLSFAVIEEAGIKGYVENWARGMGGLTDLQVDVDDEVSEVNGLQHIYSVGSAKLEGKPIQWDLTIVKGGRKVLAVMALGEDLDDAAVQKVYASIRRIQPGRPTKGQDRGTNAPLADDGFDTPEGEPEPEAEEAANEEPPPL